MGPWSHEEEVEDFRGDVDLSAAVTVIRDHELVFYDRFLKDESNDWDARPPLELYVLGANEWRGEHEWPLAANRVQRRGTCAAAARSIADVPRVGRAGRPLRLRPGGSGADDRRRQLGADDDAGRRDADAPGPDRPARARAARRRARLHERAARARPRGDRPRRDGAVRGVEREGHRLHRAPLRRPSRRPLDLRHRGHPPRAVPELERGRLDGAARAERGRGVPDPLLPGGERLQARATGSGST